MAGPAPEHTFEQFFGDLLKRHRGLEAILISDTVGMVHIKVSADHLADPPISKRIAATFILATEQASKLHMGNNRSILLFYKSHILLQFAELPVLVTLVADNKDGCGNAGLLYTVKDQMQRSPVMAELKLVIERETDMDDTFLA
eukprot:EG_transcript_36097